MILAFDTSAAHCAAALLSGPDILAQRQEAMTRGQAERLMPMLEELLAEAGATWTDLAAIGVGTGPGNFTGTRIAVSAARGLALALEIPAIGVSGLEAAAEGVPRPTIACLPAPRGQVYLQGFGTGPSEPALAPLDALPALSDTAVLAGPAAQDLTRAGAVVAASPPVAVAIARIAAGRMAQPSAPPKPLYLRPPDAALPSEQPPAILDDA